MTIPEALIEAAWRRGARHCFGVPGSGALMDLIDAGRRRGVEFVSTANEASATIAAAYYGHLRGCAGLALAIKGPGAGNLVGGAVNAYFERKPVVCITEALPEAFVPVEMGQRIDQPGLFRTAAKQVARLVPADAGAAIDAAFDCAAAGRPGPVLLDLPGDLGGAEAGTATHAAPGAAGAPTTAADAQAVAAATTAVAEMRRPVIIAGGDLLRAAAQDELERLAERIGAAVLVAIDARGALAEDHPRFAGVFACLPPTAVLANRVLTEADGVILAGVDPLAAEAPWQAQLPTVELVADRAYQTLSPLPRARVDGPLGATLAALAAAAGERADAGFPVAAIHRLQAAVGDRFARPGAARFAVQDIIESIRAALPRDGMLFSESAAFVLMLEYLWPVYRPDTFFGSAGGRTMGLMLPAILGARLARPQSAMVGLGGDGSALMRLGELEAFARTGAAVPLVIVNDQAYGTIRARQRARGFPAYSLDLEPVDYAQVARACGLHGVTVSDPDEFRTALRQALNADTATLIDARVDPEPYWASFVPTTGAE